MWILTWILLRRIQWNQESIMRFAMSKVCRQKCLDIWLALLTISIPFTSVYLRLVNYLIKIKKTGKTLSIGLWRMMPKIVMTHSSGLSAIKGAWLIALTISAPHLIINLASQLTRDTTLDIMLDTTALEITKSESQKELCFTFEPIW